MKQNKNLRILRALRVGVILTLIFTAITSLFWVKYFSLQTVLTCFYVSALFCFGLGTGTVILTTLLDHWFSWASKFNKRLLYGIPITISYIIVTVLLIDYLVYYRIFNNPIEEFWSFEGIKMHSFYIAISMGISTFYYAKSFLAHLRKSMAKQIELEKDKVQLKYEALKNQIDPHFFFNNLNVLSSLVEEDQEQSQQFIQQMTKIYRYVLEQKSKEITTLKEEIAFVDQYIFLQKARFEEGVQLKIDIEQSLLEKQVVVLSMQLLLENIFKHNAISDETPISIEIGIEQDYVIIRNNINPKRILPHSNKIGLENIKQRYSLLTDNPVIVENYGQYFIVKLPLL
ncbi:histidine kinase [Prolixibacteraceae bacterium JC049]|nr:histidine kinase [Prolixibacteraceae bacterium JC049]